MIFRLDCPVFHPSNVIVLEGIKSSRQPLPGSCRGDVLLRRVRAGSGLCAYLPCGESRPLSSGRGGFQSAHPLFPEEKAEPAINNGPGVIGGGFSWLTAKPVAEDCPG